MMSSLRAELEQVLKAYASIDDNELGEDKFNGHHDTAIALQAILATLQTAVLAAALEKIAPDYTKPFLAPDKQGEAYVRGHNKAVEAYTKALQQLFESEELV